nr:expansin-like B1 [Ipomoea batatas]GMD82243.1 expansin-like B1 [Ipomoea batatas]
MLTNEFVHGYARFDQTGHVAIKTTEDSLMAAKSAPSLTSSSTMELLVVHVTSSTGTKVVVTDNGGGPTGTDFICSYVGFRKMAKAGKEDELVKKGIVGITYEKVPCDYTDSVAIKVTDQSSNPGYLSILVLNAGDVASVEVYDTESGTWIAMRRVYGAVFDLSNPPEGELQVRLQIGTSTDYSKNPIPDTWTAGDVIDTGIHY